MSLFWKCRVGSISVIISIINHIMDLKTKSHEHLNRYRKKIFDRIHVSLIKVLERTGL